MNLRPRASAAPSTLLNRLAERLPAGLVLLSDATRDDTAGLFPAERDSVARAVASRRAEFATGRRLARQCLLELGRAPEAIPSGEFREPVWPAGVVGSLTHSDSVCAVVLGRAADFRGVGLDLELASPLQPGLADIIVSSVEPPAHREPDTLRLVFSAKESVYKCLFPICREFLDFHDMEIRVDRSASTFLARPLRPAAGLAALGTGLFEKDERGVATLFTLAPDEGARADRR